MTDKKVETIKDIIERINLTGKYRVDTESRIIYEKIGNGWFMHCKYWCKRDLENFEKEKCQH